MPGLEPAVPRSPCALRQLRPVSSGRSRLGSEPRGPAASGSALDSSRSRCGAVPCEQAASAFRDRSVSAPGTATPSLRAQGWSSEIPSSVSLLQAVGRDARFQSSRRSVRISLSYRIPGPQRPGCALRALRSRELTGPDS